MMKDENKYALLIDAENVSSKYIEIVTKEAQTLGNVTIRRIYGDWTASSKNSWKDSLLENSLSPIQQYSYTVGKNSSDSAMIIDAMDILYSGRVSGFCLVTSDSDFTKLAIRLREAGMLVIGMGEKKTPPSLVAACESFKFLYLLYQENAKNNERNKARAAKQEGGKKEVEEPKKKEQEEKTEVILIQAT